MKTKIIKDQQWAMTGNYECFCLREGFYIHCDVSAIDAPSYVPSGSTVENIVAGVDGTEDTRAVIGGLVAVR